MSLVPIHNAAVGLHTLLRRYCGNRIAYWHSEYQKLPPEAVRAGANYSDEACAIFPRYTILSDILEEAERLDSDVLTDFDDVRERLVIASQLACDSFASRKDIRQEKVIAEERELVCAFLRMQLPADSVAAEPLPYSYRLSTADSASMRSRIRSCWGIDKFCWYPLGVPKPDTAEAFRWSRLEEELSESWLCDALAMRGIDRYWLMHEFGWDRIESRLLVTPGYVDGAESILSSQGLDWIAYFSHEDSATFGGWTLELVKELVPDWSSYLYTSEF